MSHLSRSHSCIITPTSPARAPRGLDRSSRVTLTHRLTASLGTTVSCYSLSYITGSLTFLFTFNELRFGQVIINTTWAYTDHNLTVFTGAMASFAFFYLAGLYPVPATRQFLLSSPFFPQISFFNPLFNSTTTIKANGFQGNPKSGTGGHVFVEVHFCLRTLHCCFLIHFFQSVKVDGKPYKSNCFLDWDVFQNGSSVELQLSSNINVSCGNGPNALPPSLSTGGFGSP